MDENILDLAVHDGPVLLIEESKIVFAVKGMLFIASEGGDPKETTVFFRFEENKDKLKLLDAKSFTGSYLFFQWEGKIFKTPTNKENIVNYDDVMVFDANTNNFTKSNNSITYLRDFLKDKNKFVNVNIGGKSVLLLIEERKMGNGIIHVHLWITDGSRVSHVGNIITVVHKLFYGSVLYTDDELFALHEKDESGSGGQNKKIFSLTLLKKQLENIKNTLTNWNNGNNNINKLCKEINNNNNACTPPPTAGLVGFLRDTTDGGSGTTIWKDEYYYSTVTVEKGKGTKVPNGFTFSGEGAGAKWSIESGQVNHPYNFTDPGFTLVATVKIEENEKDFANSLLGLVISKGNKRVELWCSKLKKWAVGDEKGADLMNDKKEECEQGRTYNVVVVLKNENLEIYVNGTKLTFSDKKIIKINKGENITDIYFGVNGRETQTLQKAAVTITNVLLYNRPFTTDEFDQLQPKLNDAAGAQTHVENDGTKQQNPNGSTTQTKQPPGTSAAQNNENEIKVRSSSTEDNAVRVVVSVLSLLFGLFTFVGRYV